MGGFFSPSDFNFKGKEEFYPLRPTVQFFEKEAFFPSTKQAELDLEKKN